MRRPEILIATRELHPFMGGGIAPVVAAEARVLSEIADVTLMTTVEHRERYLELSADGPLFGAGVEVVFVEEPEPDHPGFYSFMHAWSAQLHQAILDRYPERGPDLIEFCDYLAEGFTTIQAKRTADPRLSETIVAVRAHTTGELCRVLDGSVPSDFATRTIYEAERYCVRYADRLLHGGGDVYDTYRRYYGASGVAPGAQVADAFLIEGDPPTDLGPRRPDNIDLRILYLGRLERRKGVQDLIAATSRTGAENWRLTLLGGDTDTAPLKTSMRDHLELVAAGDERVHLADPVPRSEVGALIAMHDLVVVPSLWECWPNVVREAFLHNRPVLATPVGGHVAMVEEGVSGWLTEGTGPEAILAGLERLIADPGQVRRLIEAGGPRAAFDRISDPARTRRDYTRLLEERAERPAARPSTTPPLVSVVVPYFKLDEHVRETLLSVQRQTYPRTEVIVVDDGSFRRQDRVLLDLRRELPFTLISQPNAGLGAARNFGIAQARGRYVLPLDADNLLEPQFVERCVAALEADPSLAYVTSWSHYVDETGRRLELPANSYTPFGNWTRMLAEQNLAGDGTALLRRHLFDLGLRYRTELTSYEDWFLYRELAHAGHLGAVIPERLFLYRVRAQSMLRQVGMVNNDAIFEEMEALIAETEMTWTPKNA